MGSCLNKLTEGGTQEWESGNETGGKITVSISLEKKVSSSFLIVMKNDSYHDSYHILAYFGN